MIATLSFNNMIIIANDVANMITYVAHLTNEIPVLIMWLDNTEVPNLNPTMAAPMKMLMNTQLELIQTTQSSMSVMEELMPSLENMTSRSWDHTKREEDKSARGSPIVQAGEQEFIRTTGRIILMTILLITGRFIGFYHAFLP